MHSKNDIYLHLRITCTTSISRSLSNPRYWKLSDLDAKAWMIHKRCFQRRMTLATEIRESFKAQKSLTSDPPPPFPLKGTGAVAYIASGHRPYMIYYRINKVTLIFYLILNSPVFDNLRHDPRISSFAEQISGSGRKRVSVYVIDFNFIGTGNAVENKYRYN